MRGLICGFITLTICWTGCSQSPTSNAKLPDTHPVSGVVIFEGEPIADAIVNFQLTNGTRGATGKTNDKGEFALMTFSPGDGAVPGDYQVSIVKYSAPPADYPPPPEEPDTQYVPFKAENMLPKKYSQHETSGLTAVVSPGENRVKFELTK